MTSISDIRVCIINHMTVHALYVTARPSDCIGQGLLGQGLLATIFFMSYVR